MNPTLPNLPGAILLLGLVWALWSAYRDVRNEQD